MNLFIDADACPKVIRELIIKTAIRKKQAVLFVSNSYISLPKSPFISQKVVAQGFDVADDTIVALCGKDDLVVTNDIPLANDALNKNAKVLSFTGMEYTQENIKQRLNMRDFMDTMRGTGMLDPAQMGGQKPFSASDKKSFADGLNRLWQSSS